MYVGYIAMGPDDPFSQPVESVEVVNNMRAYSYARWAGLDWVMECDVCEGLDQITSGGKGFNSPILDPAPWYDPNNPDTWGFLGVIGMEVTGASDSTRQANVSMSLTGVGVIGPTYMAPREMVVRALAIAQDDCSLEAGILWLRRQYSLTLNPCGGDPMTFFDCCPCICDDVGSGGPCWVEVYRELRTDPDDCDPVFWPTTYGELIVGPPPEDEEWCDWPDVYGELRFGPPGWTCCVEECLRPYMRQFHNSRVTSGPVIIRRPDMSCGALAEIEFTIVAGDPMVHGMPGATVRAFMGDEATDPLIDDPLPTAPFVDPFAAVA